MTNANEPAFAAVEPDYIQPGLTKREYFAAMMLQGSLSGSNLTDFITSAAMDQYAKEAVSMADALIKALNEQT